MCGYADAARDLWKAGRERPDRTVPDCARKNIDAYVWGKEVALPSLFQAIADLRRRVHVFAMLVLTGR